MKSANWGSPLFTAESAASAEAYICRIFPVRYHSNSRVNVSSGVDTRGNGANIWKIYSCICVGRRGNTCGVKLKYKYNTDKEYDVFQSEGEHALPDSGKKRKLGECSTGFKNALVAMVSSGSQPAHIVEAMLHKSLEQQRYIFPNVIYAVISAE
jgi:hypothetical protein